MQVYAVLGIQLDQYREIKSKFDVPLKGEFDKIDYHVFPEQHNSRQNFLRCFYIGVDKIENHLQALDVEISRRKKLIGSVC